MDGTHVIIHGRNSKFQCLEFPNLLEMLMMDAPLPASLIREPTYFEHNRAPSRFIFNTRFHSSSLNFNNVLYIYIIITEFLFSTRYSCVFYLKNYAHFSTFQIQINTIIADASYLTFFNHFIVGARLLRNQKSS